MTHSALFFVAVLFGSLKFLTSAEYALKALPFKEDALEPLISAVTVSTHYNKHHAGYVNKLNKERESTNKLNDVSLTDIIKNTDYFPVKVVNLASQIYNHEFYWDCINPMDKTKKEKKKENEQDRPYGISTALFFAINGGFQSFDNFKNEFKSRAKKHFGSGWLWLSIKDGRLKVADGHDAQNPMSFGETPLLTIDIWEHAYYLDYKNERGRYVDGFFENINWKFVSQKFSDVLAKKDEL